MSTCTEGIALIQQALEMSRIAFTPSHSSAHYKSHFHTQNPFRAIVPGKIKTKFMCFDALL